LLHHFGEVGGVEIFKFFVGDAKLYPAKRIRLDEVDELPADGALGELALELANESGGGEALEKATDGAVNADVDLSDAELEVGVSAQFGEIDVVDADDFAAGGVDDLLIEKIFLDGKPGFIGLIGGEGTFVDVEIDAAWNDVGDLVVAGDDGLIPAAGD